MPIKRNPSQKLNANTCVQGDFWENTHHVISTDHSSPQDEIPQSKNFTVQNNRLFIPSDTYPLFLERLVALSHSPFRSRFFLKQKERQYIQDKGLETMIKHAHHFVRNRLAPAHILNDGKQTPWHGHPVFIAQHATGTCCRNCLQKWHKIKPHHALSWQQQDYVVTMIMVWIQKQLDR